MRKIFTALAVAALALAGCGTTGDDEPTVTDTPVVTSTSTTTSATSSVTPTRSTTEEQPAEENVELPTEQPVLVEQATTPTFVRCEMFNGTALMSDGSTTYLETCDENAGGVVPGNVVSPTYTAEDEAALASYMACVEEHGADYCMKQLHSEP